MIHQNMKILSFFLQLINEIWKTLFYILERLKKSYISQWTPWITWFFYYYWKVCGNAGSLFVHDEILRGTWSGFGVIRYVVLCKSGQRQGIWMGQPQWPGRIVCAENKCFESLFLADALRNTQVQATCCRVCSPDPFIFSTNLFSCFYSRCLFCLIFVL